MDKAKKLLGILGEKSIKEGARINLNYFTLTPGEHPIALIKEELQQLVETMDDWREDGWSKVSAPDKKHQEIIPLMDKADAMQRLSKANPDRLGGRRDSFDDIQRAEINKRS